MNYLFIDLASHSTLSNEGACIACVDDTHTKAIHFIDERISDDGLIPALDHTLASAVWDYKDLTHIACVTGPGGFTSLRMAVSLANTLADQLKIPAAGVHLSDVYEARARAAKSFVWFHSTKRGQLFVRGFGECTSMWPAPTLVSIEELQASDKLHGVGWCGELIPEHQAIAETLGMKKLPLLSLEEVLPDLVKSRQYLSTLLVPWYGRGW